MEIVNRKARFDYEVLEEYEAGIVLTGTEIKSIRDGKANIKDCYGVIREMEVYLLNMHISHYEQGNIFNHDETRTRKLLLHKKEIKKLDEGIKLKGITLVPVKLYFKENKLKVSLAVCRGKKDYDKRESIKQRDIKREVAKSLKNY